MFLSPIGVEVWIIDQMQFSMQKFYFILFCVFCMCIYVTPVGVCLSSKFQNFCKALIPLKAGASPQPLPGTYSIFSNRKARCSRERSVGLNQLRKRPDWVHQSRSPRVSFHLDIPVLNVWRHVLVPPRLYKGNYSRHNSSFPVSELFCFPVETESQFYELEPSTLSPGTRDLWDHLKLQEDSLFLSCVGRLLPRIIIICSCTSPLRPKARARECWFIAWTTDPFPNSVRMVGSALPSTDWECVTYILGKQIVSVQGPLLWTDGHLWKLYLSTLFGCSP